MKQLKRAALLTLCAILAFAALSCCGGNPSETETEAMTDEPENTVQRAVYLRDDGNDENDGTAFDQSVATYERAFELLTEERNVLVFCGTAPIVAATVNLPETEFPIKMTSVWDGVDYRTENNAKIGVSAAFSFNSDVTIEHFALEARSTTSRLFCNFHNVTIGEDVTVKESSRRLHLYAGYFVSAAAINEPGHTTSSAVSHKGDCTITVLSGAFTSFTGGNFRADRLSPVGTFNGNLTVRLGGSCSFDAPFPENDRTAPFVSAAGANFCIGNVTLEITGGSFNCPIYGIGHRGTIMDKMAANQQIGTDGCQISKKVAYTSDVSVRITGGSFGKGVSAIRALQEPGETPLKGTYSLEIAGGSFEKTPVFSALGVLGKAKGTGIPAGAETIDFASVNGSDTTASRALRIACCGDSITWGTAATDGAEDGYNYPAAHFSYPSRLQDMYGDTAVVGNFGYPGSNISPTSYADYYGSQTYHLMTEFAPDVIVFALGTNNAGVMPNSAGTTESRYKEMLTNVHKVFPDCRVIMTTALYRWDLAERDKALEDYIIPIQKRVAASFDFVELYDARTAFRPYGTSTYYADKLHPNNAGYKKLAEIMYVGINK